MKLKYKLLDERAKAPRRAHPRDAGLDLAPLSPLKLWPHSTEKVDTGIAVEIPPGHVGLIFSRSSLQVDGISVSGVVDSDYRGSIHLIVTNHEPDVARPTGYIAQMVICSCIAPELERVEELSVTERQDKGFGSTDAM